MNRRERFHAAIAGEAIDRAPVCVWQHFVTPFLPGAESAKLHCRFFRHYGWDVAKAVSDYRFPLPEGMSGIETVEDMARIKAPDMSHPTYQDQLDLLKGIRSEMGEEWPVIDTVFDPIQQIIRRTGFTSVKMFIDNPAQARPMIDAATDTVIRYVRELKKIDVDGVLYSTRAAATEGCAQGYTKESFEELFKDCDIAIMEEMKGMVRIIHACKSHLDLSRVDDYPHEALSWADRDPTCPTLKEARAMSDKCLMGGINQNAVIEQSEAEIHRDVKDAYDQTGGKNFILAPGCTIGSHAPDHVFKALATYAEPVAA